MTKKLNLEICNCIIQESENRELYEIAYLLGKMTIDDVLQALVEEGINTHSIIIKQHMARHISLDVQEKIVDYLPSVASTCSQMLSRVKARAIIFLDKPTLEKDEIRLLGTLIAESGKFVDKLGVLNGDPTTVSPINMHVPSSFEEAAMAILPSHPIIWKEIRDKMEEIDNK